MRCKKPEGMSTTPLFTESSTLSLYSVSFAKPWQKLQDGVCDEEKNIFDIGSMK